jgi:hypothetical protein
MTEPNGQAVILLRPRAPPVSRGLTSDDGGFMTVVSAPVTDGESSDKPDVPHPGGVTCSRPTHPLGPRP